MTQPTQPTWSIVTTCAEPRALMDAFVAHHLEQGAEQIFLCFDDPNDLSLDRLSKVPRVTCIKCDEKHWSRLSAKVGRPKGHRRRQTLNAEFVSNRLCKTDWITHIDADEFLLPRNENSIVSLLAAVPDHIDAMRILPAERAFKDYYAPGVISLDGIYKLKPDGARNEWGRKIYGDLGELFPNGFQGHEVGKSFKRSRNKNARLNIHFVRHNGENIEESKVKQSDGVLLHLFPASFEDWCYKFERRIFDVEYFNDMPKRARRKYGIYGEVLSRNGRMGLSKLFDRLCVMKSDMEIILESPDMFIEPNINLKEIVSKHIEPYVKLAAFSHLSKPTPKKVEDDERVFQIGMNRSGSKEICQMFERRGWSYAHWDHGQLAADLRNSILNGIRPFQGYDNYQLISDISISGGGGGVYDGFYDIEYISSYYPRSIFLLNHRPVEEWLNSRSTFRSGQYLSEHRDAYDLNSDNEVFEKWRSDWKSHVEKLRLMGESGRINLIEYSLNTDRPNLFFEKLDNMMASSIEKDG